MTNSKGFTLYQNVLSHVSNPQVAALLAESELNPIAGRGAPFAPPTYALSDSKDTKKLDPKEKKKPNFAVSQGVPIPTKNESGWFQDLRRNPETGELHRSAQVIVSSIGAESGNAETALINHPIFGKSLPGIFVCGTKNSDRANKKSKAPSDLGEQIDQALSAEISTWTAAHRQADAWIKFAQTPDGKQVWEGGHLDDQESVKELIIAASPANGSLLYSLFPNSALFGYWLSSGTAIRHKMPRSYSSQIVGYGATPIVSASTMMDPNGGASSDSKVSIAGHRLVMDTKGEKPSKLGFGPVPSSPETRAFSCELILQRATISLANLRHISFQSIGQQNAAITALSLMGILGHQLANRDGFYRSSCALTTISSKWGWRYQGRGESEIEDLSLDDIETVEAALKIAIKAAQEQGLTFRDPIQLTYSTAQQELIRKRMEKEDNKLEFGDGDDA